MHPPYPHGDQPDASLLRLVLMGDILRADETLLVLLADLVQPSGLLHLSEKPTAPRVQPQQGALRTLRRSGADRQGAVCSTWRVLPHVRVLNLFPSSMLHCVC